MKRTFFILSLMVTLTNVMAQSKSTTSGVVSFDATTPKDALPKADNKTVIGELNTKTGDLGFEAAVKSFAFSNPMIQEHFNGNKWFDSDKFPLFTFTGKINDLSKVNFSKDGTYAVAVSGDLTIKDVTKPISTTAKIVVAGGTLTTSSSFTIKLADFGVSSTHIESGKVAAEPKITVSATLK